MKRCSKCDCELTEENRSPIRKAYGKVYYRTVCRDCRNKAKRLARRGRLYFGNANVEILFDPLPLSEGGFQKGALFSMGDVRMMLKYKHMTKGTLVRLRRKHGKLKAGNYKVMGGGNIQRLVKI